MSSVSLRLLCPAPCPRREVLTNWRVNAVLCLDSLYWEAGLAADVNASPNGQRKPSVSKLQFAQGSAMGISMMMAMITIM